MRLSFWTGGAWALICGFRDEITRLEREIAVAESEEQRQHLVEQLEQTQARQFEVRSGFGQLIF
jgi:hypothetical protein